MNAKCPVCGLIVELPEDVMEGEVIEHECGATLEVVVGGDKQYSLKVISELTEDWGE